MVVPPHRDGGQAQYVDQPVAPSCDGTLRDLLEWLRVHLDQPLTVRLLAARANMSERTFARRFVQDTGTTPQRWLIGQRILLAQQLLEESDDTVDAIADRTGFGNATALRHRLPRLARHHSQRLPPPLPRGSAGFFPVWTPLRPRVEHPSDLALNLHLVEHSSDLASNTAPTRVEHPSDLASNTAPTQVISGL